MNIWQRYIFNVLIEGEDGGGGTTPTPPPPAPAPYTPPGGHPVETPELPPPAPDIAVDTETGQIYDVTNPSDPVNITPTPEVSEIPSTQVTPTPLVAPTSSQPGETVTLADNTMVDKAAFEKLDQQTQQIFREKGYESGVEHIQKERKKAIEGYRYDRKQAELEWEEDKRVYDSAINQLEPYKVSVPIGTRGGTKAHTSAYNINQYLLDANSPGEALQTLRNAGYSDKQIQNASNENLAWATEARQMVEKQYSAANVAKYAGGLAADMIVPGYYTARNWSNMGVVVCPVPSVVAVASVVHPVGVAGGLPLAFLVRPFRAVYKYPGVSVRFWLK